MNDRPNGKQSTMQKLLQVLPGRSAPSPERELPPDQEEIELWLVDHIAKALEVDPDELDIRTPIGDFGLNSRTAVRLSGEMERWLGRRLSPTLVWDFPTIQRMAVYLAEGADSDSTDDTGWQQEDPETGIAAEDYHER